MIRFVIVLATMALASGAGAQEKRPAAQPLRGATPIPETSDSGIYKMERHDRVIPRSHAWQPPIGALTHPFTLSHESVVQAFPSLQLGAPPGWQVPLWQVSAPLQTSASGQGVPSASSVWTHWACTSSQVSTVQTFESSQFFGAPGWQDPPEQVSPRVHPLLSSHGAVFGV